MRPILAAVLAAILLSSNASAAEPTAAGVEFF